MLFVAQRGHNALYVALESGHVGIVALLLDFMYSVDNKVRHRCMHADIMVCVCQT